MRRRRKRRGGEGKGARWAVGTVCACAPQVQCCPWRTAGDVSSAASCGFLLSLTRGAPCSEGTWGHRGGSTRASTRAFLLREELALLLGRKHGLGCPPPPAPGTVLADQAGLPRLWPPRCLSLGIWFPDLPSDRRVRDLGREEDPRGRQTCPAVPADVSRSPPPASSGFSLRPVCRSGSSRGEGPCPAVVPTGRGHGATGHHSHPSVGW